MYNNKNSQDQIIRKEKSSNLIINWVNYYVKKEQENAIGITLIYIIVGSGIASITGALAVKNPISMPILITAALLSMGTNVSVLSQRTFKTSTWFFFISILINSLLLIYQIIIKD
jgi:hypothetical protein